jgi:hypothetical protein
MSRGEEKERDGLTQMLEEKLPFEASASFTTSQE